MSSLMTFCTAGCILLRFHFFYAPWIIFLVSSSTFRYSENHSFDHTVFAVTMGFCTAKVLSSAWNCCTLAQTCQNIVVSKFLLLFFLNPVPFLKFGFKVLMKVLLIGCICQHKCDQRNKTLLIFLAFYIRSLFKASKQTNKQKFGRDLKTRRNLLGLKKGQAKRGLPHFIKC